MSKTVEGIVTMAQQQIKRLTSKCDQRQISHQLDTYEENGKFAVGLVP
jgi:hypothetical protein